MMTKGTPLFLMVYLFLILMGSCAPLKDAVKDQFTYSFSEGFCTTGEKSFNTKTEMCIALQNTSSNNGCAQIQRQDFFNSNCSGTFTPTIKKNPIFFISFKLDFKSITTPDTVRRTLIP